MGMKGEVRPGVGPRPLLLSRKRFQVLVPHDGCFGSSMKWVEVPERAEDPRVRRGRQRLRRHEERRQRDDPVVVEVLSHQEECMGGSPQSWSLGESVGSPPIFNPVVQLTQGGQSPTEAAAGSHRGGFVLKGQALR
ncbi:hypothetical protein HMPREF9440_01032 [Sutterella parvirubra YIT 11816]|uniref:Uncharacterized protein n=1 Tax=Sutterella parvirubra YIT 11816 TaxID=762967 RepID=H3KE68_9BURK|nr:hypothetical protein HMPREF9440_01032 [Sutterella parvirubra YIT 11816]